MSRSYPMWFDVQNCNYKSGKSSYGGREDANTTIKVGSSGSNSHEFLDFRTTKRNETWKGKNVVVFRHSVDGVVLKAIIFEADSKGRAIGKPLRIVTKLNRIKSVVI